MDAAHRRVLTKNARLLNKDLVIDEDFLSVFEEKAIFTPTNTEEIKSKGSGSGIRSAFRNLLPMRGPKAFPTFIEALVETRQDHIAQTLDPALATKLIRDREHPEESSVDGASELSTLGPTHPVQPARTVVDTGEQLITMDILDVHPTTAKRLLADSQHVYSMKSPKRGRAIILNNECFETKAKLSNREGSAQDAMNLERLFNRLSFEADSWVNLTSKEIGNKIAQERIHEAHKEADAFIFTILSHGNRGNIFGTDGELVNLDNIFTQFDGKNCPSLIGKPKMFFIQACQGEDESRIKSDSHATEQEPIQEQVDPRRLQVDTTATIPNIHEKADFVLAYATVPGYKSWRNTVEGTWFIRDLIYTFMERCHTDHLADMLLEVNSKAQKRTTKRTKVRQVSETRSSANKKIFFLPGYSE